MARASFPELLNARDWLLADGATGTNLFAMGLANGEPPEFWTTEKPENIRALHQGFVDAGSDIILTNTFGCNRHRLKLHNAEARVPELNEKAARLAGAVAEAADRPVIVAGSVGPTGEIFMPAGTMSMEEGIEAFSEQIAALAEGGIDVVWIETMSAEEEVRAAVTAARKVAPDLPVVVTMSFDTAGRTMMGVTPAQLAALAQELNLTAFGSNCGTGAPDLLVGILEMTEAAPDAVVVAKANAGVPEFVDGEIHYSGTVEMAGAYARMALDAGARIIGGCCGNTFAHVRAMHEALKGYEKGPRPTVEDIVKKLGPLSQKRAEGHACGHDHGGRGGRRRRRRRRDNPESE
ncbi:betaine--homocysteine S-methyltransferase [Thermopetrobacter sp. TC1]|uniref:betaine--homocysteine S-methyltransferase n=1 Tax=Thermopetrobacter sp. TC1 TaxID=1495045 RepID=UPI0005714328|nr:betaine--homocysteine S-methyltransferase [Thermopetrobacter sp. TC1]